MATRSTSKSSANVTTISKQLLTLADKNYAIKCTRFFKTGPGEYAEHDRFLGIRVPELRALAKAHRTTITLDECCTLLRNDWHEFRLFALLAMIELFQRGDNKQKKAVITQYFKLKAYINNWDLVDASAYKIPGPWYFDKDRSPLHRMIQAKSLWERRIPVLSTFHYIRKNDLDDTFNYAEQLLNDPEDLVHKATGWMLREAGKRDQPRLIRFLEAHHKQMPNTMFSYATEKLAKNTKARFKKPRK